MTNNAQGGNLHGVDTPCILWYKGGGHFTMRDTFSQLVRLGIIIVLVAMLLGWADSTFFAPNRVPPCVQEELPEGHICYEKLRADWGDRIVWIDARSLSDFEVNHLNFPDVRMFPIRKGADKQAQIDAAMERLLQATERKECIVVFCTDDCTNADDIAKELRAIDIIDAPILVLEGGWATLLANGMVKR